MCQATRASPKASRELGSCQPQACTPNGRCQPHLRTPLAALRLPLFLLLTGNASQVLPGPAGLRTRTREEGPRTALGRIAHPQEREKGHKCDTGGQGGTWRDSDASRAQRLGDITSPIHPSTHPPIMPLTCSGAIPGQGPRVSPVPGRSDRGERNKLWPKSHDPGSPRGSVTTQRCELGYVASAF